MTDDPLIGRRLANFRIERLIGHGGMAQVYYGQDVTLHRPVAIKVIDARYRGSESYAERFVREARTVATWRHENIMQVHYADVQEGIYYFVMEYIDGPDLAHLLSQYADDGELMPQEDVLRIGWAVADALDYAHKRGVIHRDVKPSNVMVASDSRVVLADFGLAMDVQQGTMGEVFGTPHYIAPEQARRSADAIPQSDLYALGVVLYEMLTGAVPFDDPSPASLALQHLTLPPPPPCDINPALGVETERVLLKALSKSPDERYQTGVDLMRALEASLSTSQESAEGFMELPPPPAGVRQPSLSRRTVADRVAQHVRTTSTALAFQGPLVPSSTSESSAAPASSGMRRNTGILVGAVVAVLVIVTGFVLYAVLSNDGGDKSSTASVPLPTSTEEAVAQAEITLTATDSPTLSTPTGMPIETAVPEIVITTPPSPTDTTAVMPIQPPTLTPIVSYTPPPMPSVTPTAAATFTFTPSPSVTSLPTATALPSQPMEPTVMYPNGRQFLLYYDENSLCLHNNSGDRVPLNPFAFERLNASGVPLNRLEGGRWAQFYPYVHHLSCARLLIGNAATYLNPAECQAYNAEVWVERGRSLDFWTSQEGSAQFRVLWSDEEIARCEIAAGRCEVFLP
jgi:serine/threonine protein kinase